MNKKEMLEEIASYLLDLKKDIRDLKKDIEDIKKSATYNFISNKLLFEKNTCQSCGIDLNKNAVCMSTTCPYRLQITCHSNER